MNNEPITIPKHIAIIMDGNRRWAREHHLPVIEGHRRVVNDVLEKLIQHAGDCGVRYVTLWAWSTENWGRDAEEVGGIMNLLRLGFEKFGGRMHKKGMKIRTIGDLTKLDTDIQQSIQKLVELTRHNTKITVIFALNYGGRDEMIRAMNKIIRDKRQVQRGKQDAPLVSGLLSPVAEQSFSEYLDTAGIPDPEIIIRTGGERRLSGFLLWQCEYSELFFCDWYMPDFTPERFDEVLEEYAHRQRRFGK